MPLFDLQLFQSLANLSCKLRRLLISSVKSLASPSGTGGAKLFFTKNQSLEILQLTNANLSTDFLKYEKNTSKSEHGFGVF